MTRLTVAGALLAAEDRTLKGRLLPFRTPGHTNLGRVIVHPGGVTIPNDLATLHASLDHLDGRDNVATFASIEEREDGLHASWTVPATHGGDRLLAEFRAGQRTGISVELEPVTIRDGVATGVLIGCAFPTEPAFPTARLVAELAPDTDDDTPKPPADEPVDEDTAPAATEAPTQGDTTVTVPTPAPATADDLLTAAAAPTPTQAPARLTAADATRSEVERLLAGLHGATGSGRERLLAALSDIIPANIIDRDQPAWLGEVWSGKRYERRIVPLLSRADLTGLKVKGWRWTTKPEMGKYAGNKAAIPSNAVDTEPYEEEAQRFAGGHDIDRKYRDFGDSAFFASYFDAMAESYSRLTDAYALERMKAEAIPLTIGSVPTDVPTGWVAVVDAALAVIDVGTPSFALVEKTVYRDMLFTRQDKFLEFLNASIGFEDGTLNSSNFKIVPVASSAVGTASSPTGLDRGEVMVGCRQAVTFRELGGGSPIRVDAVDIARGGIDEACFGYAHVDVYDARGLRIVDLTTDA